MQKELLGFLQSRKKMNLLMTLLNIAVFLIMELSGGDTLDTLYMMEHGAMYPSAVVQDGEYYRLFTCMFLHFGAQHLLYNMLLLIFAGDMLEAKTGALRYLLIYLLGGAAGNGLSLAIHIYNGTETVSAGASGAIFAVLGGLIFLIVKNRGHLEGVHAKGVCVMAVLSLAQGFMDVGVDNYAHLGGFLGGFLLAAVSEILRRHPAERRSE